MTLYDELFTEAFTGSDPINDASVTTDCSGLYFRFRLRLGVLRSYSSSWLSGSWLSTSCSFTWMEQCSVSWVTGRAGICVPHSFCFRTVVGTVAEVVGAVPVTEWLQNQCLKKHKNEQTSRS